MKKLLFSIVIASIGLLNVHAQDKGSFEFGIAAGLNYSEVTLININTDENITLNAGHLFRMNIGASAEYYFSDMWGIKLKVIRDGKGFSDGIIFGDNFQQNTDFELNYLSVPVMVNFHFGSRRNWYANVGPYVGFLTDVDDSENLGEELGIDLKEGFKSTDVGLAFGVGYKLKIVENFKLFVEFDGQKGFLEIFQENQLDPITNTRLSLNIGGLFSL